MRSPVRGSVIALLAIAMSGLAACTITLGERRESPLSPVETPNATADPTPGERSISAPGRLAVLEADGSLYTTEANGSDRVDLISSQGSALTALQPAWSPEGDRLAWVISQARDGAIAGAIVVAGPRGEDPVISPTPFVPYYLSWSPAGDRVAFLGAGGDPEAPVQMGVLDVSRADAEARAIAGGDPFLYFAWGPDGRRVLAHAGFDRLEEVDLDGRATSVSDRPGLFAAPAWSDDGRTLVYVERGPNGLQRLVAVSDGASPEVLVEGPGALSFVLRPDGRAVAYQMLDERDSDLFDRRPTEPRDGVRVIDLPSGAERRATSIRALTFWWSPDGKQLLALAPEPGSSGAIPFLWQVWDGGRVIDAEGRHSPTLQVLRDYAPFFTQYAQSATPWAPDGSAFAFPVSSPDGAGLIVVQEVGGDPAAIGPGVYVTWSP
ncbi:MAG: hypothetical protein M3Q20_02585 [Actinomycetota bacterium]|nr:hypothetical protein [Actinomycetota bacterium]